jgi:amino-acid N-acetyltransferase
MTIAQATIRRARIEDVPAICDLVNYYAERGLMLHRSRESTYEALREFQVALDEDGRLLGCVAVDVVWADLAEVKSLAVTPDARGTGLGHKLIQAAVTDAARLGIRKLFALTYEQAFFERQGFSVLDRQALPEKVWRECLFCPKADCCDEIAMIRRL